MAGLVASRLYEGPIRRAKAWGARLTLVPDIVITGEPGVRMWPLSRDLPPGKAVSVQPPTSKAEF